MTNITVVYYSSTGNVHTLATAVAEGAASTGAEVRLRRAAELAPDEAIDANPAWRAHVDATAGSVEVATADDLIWADGYAFGTPTRYGTPSAQLKQFIDGLGGPWSQGLLADKGATAFTSAGNTHGGNESTILTLFNVFSHFGAVIVPPGYTDGVTGPAGGNPYGTSAPTGDGSSPISEEILAAARYQGKRLAEVSAKLRG